MNSSTGINTACFYVAREKQRERVSSRWPGLFIYPPLAPTPSRNWQATTPQTPHRPLPNPIAMHSRKRQFQPTIDTFFAREEQCLHQQASPATTSTAPSSASHAQRKVPGAGVLGLSASESTIKTLPPRPPVAMAPNPSAPGNARTRGVASIAA